MTAKILMLSMGFACLFGAAVIACFSSMISNEGRRKW